MPKLIVMFYAIIWSIVYPFYRTLRKDQGRFTSHCFLIGLWIVLIFIALLIFSVLDTGNVSVSYILGNAYFIIILTGIIVSFSWIYIHDHYFKIPAPMLESFVLKYAKKLLVTPNFSGTRKDEKPGTTLKKRIARNINLIASLVVGAAYIGIEIFLSIGLVKSGAQSEISGVIIFSILLVTTPAFLHFGLPIVTNLNASTKNKMLFVPILVIIPIVGLLRVSQKLTDSNTASSFSIYLITGPPVALFFWLLMVMINLYKRRVFYWLMIGTCLFFWIPVYILSPVSNTSVFGGENIISIVAYCLVGVGLASIALVILWKFVKLMFNILKDKFLGLRNTYRIYKLQKLRIELKRLKLLRLGSKMDIDRKSELDLIEKADGIMDLKDLYPYTEKEIKSIVVEDVDSPLEGLGGKDRAQTTIIPPQERALMAEIKKLSQQVIINQKIKAVDVRSQRDKLLESSAKIKLKQLIYLNLKNFGYWINASSFVVSYTFIIYIYFNLGSAASANERGVMTALTIVIPVIFIVLNAVIRMRSASAPPIDTEGDAFDLRFLSDKSSQDPKIKRHISKIEAIFLFFGALIIPICQIPLYFVLSDTGAKQANLFAMITSILLSFIVALLLEFKKRTGPFHKFFVPAIVSICWLFFIMPYLVLFPIVSAVIQGETDTYELFLKILVMASAFCFLLLNTSLAIIFNVILQKIEEEKLIKFVVSYLKKILKSAGVRGLDVSLRRLYDSYIRMGSQPLHDLLVRDRRPCLMVKIPEEKRSFSYSHILWLFETYARALKKKNNPDEHEDGDRKTWVEKLFKCCFSEDADDPIEILEHQEPVNEEVEMDMGRFRVDNYMPKDIQRDKDYVNGDMTFTKKTRGDALEEGDKTSRDFMTSVLEKIQQVVPNQNDQDFENAKEHAKLLMHDLDEMEEWYQHIYDYFCGRASLSALDHRSNGLIFVNFQHFLRLSCLNLRLDEEKVLSLFTDNSTKQIDEVRYLSYSEFIDVLHEVCLFLFPSIEGKKMLKKLTKLIYPPIMSGVQDIAKFYQERTRRYMQKNIVYDPHLKIFFPNTNTEEDQPLADLMITEMYHDKAAPTRLTKNVMIHPITPEPNHIDDSKSRNSEKKLVERQKPSNENTKDLILEQENLQVSRKKPSCLKTLFKPLDDIEEIEETQNDKIKIDAPPWPVVVELMMKNIPEAEKIYFEKEKNRSVKLMFNLTNFMAILGKIIEIYGYISYAFRPEIPWFSTPEVNVDVSNYLNVLNGQGISEFRYTFWFATGMVVFYMIFAIPAIKSLKKGNLGEDSEGKPAAFPQFQYFVVLVVQIFGGSLFQNIIKWLLDAFVCNFELSPWKLASDTSIECLSNTHFVYITVGLLCLLVYYPVCTFMFPNFQFQNKLLDLKYNPAWMVIVIQVKLLLSCFFSFFKSTTGSSASVTTQLVATFIVLTILAISNLYLRPCLVKKFNVWDVGLYFLAAYVNLMSLLVYFTNSSTIIAIFLGVGSGLILVTTYIVQRILYGKIVLRTKKNQVWNIGQTLQYDETKRKAEHDDLDKMKKAMKQQRNTTDPLTSEPLRTRTEDKESAPKSNQDHVTDEELLKF